MAEQSGYAWVETADGRFDGPIAQVQIGGDVWFELPDGSLIPKYRVHRLGRYIERY